MKHIRYSTGDQARPQVMRCAGCCAPIFGEASTITAGIRTDAVCDLCSQRAEDSTVYRELVGAAIQWCTTLPEINELFAGIGLRAPHRWELVHFVMTEVSCCYEASKRREARP